MIELDNSQNPDNKFLLWLALALLLLAAFALRIHRLDAVPLRGDEAYSAFFWTAMPFSEEWQVLLQREPAPAGAFTMYWGWASLAGSSEFAIRYLSLLGNVAGAAAIIILTRRILRNWYLALMSGLLWALHPYLIWHAQDARVYGVLSVLSPLAFYWLFRATHRPKGDNHAWNHYILFQTLAVYIYYFEPFWLVAQGLYILSLQSKNTLKRAMRAWVIIGVLSIPVILQLYNLMFVSKYEGNAVAADFPALFSTFVPTLLLGFNTISVWLGAVYIIFVVVCLLMITRTNRAVGSILLLWIIVPPLILYGASFVSSFFRPRYVTTIIPALIMTNLTIVAWLSPNSRRIQSALLATVVIGAASIVEVSDYFYRDQPKAQDWYGLVEYLQEHTSPEDDLIIFGHPSPDIEYYYSGKGNFFMAADDWGTPTDEIEHMLSNYRDIVVLASEDTIVIGQYLYEHAQHIPGDTYPGTIRYRNWDVAAGEVDTPLNIQFGDIAMLRGYSIIADTTLLLYWEALATTEVEYSVLLHLETSPDAPPVHVLDHALAGSIVSARTWTPGVIYRDPVTLPVDLAMDDYTMRIGFYVYETKERLTIVGTDDQHDGRYPVGVLSITR
jgi:hypothetical protein